MSIERKFPFGDKRNYHLDNVKKEGKVMSGNSNFPHDGEGHGSCSGLGCDCDEKRYGSPGRGNGDGLIWIIIAIIVAMIINAFSKGLGLLIGLPLVFIVVIFNM